MAGLSDAQPNHFGPLTPEQQAMLQRQGVQSGMSPLEMLPMTMAGGAIGAGMAGVGGLKSLVQGLMQKGMRPEAIAEYLKGIGVVGGATAGLGNVFDAINYSQRQRDTIRDAEGQPGGFYGQMPRR